MMRPHHKTLSEILNWGYSHNLQQHLPLVQCELEYQRVAQSLGSFREHQARVHWWSECTRRKQKRSYLIFFQYLLILCRHAKVPKGTKKGLTVSFLGWKLKQGRRKRRSCTCKTIPSLASSSRQNTTKEEHENFQRFLPIHCNHQDLSNQKRRTKQ